MSEELTTDELVELRDMCLDSAWYWKEHGNDYAEEKAHNMRDRINTVIVSRHVEIV